MSLLILNIIFQLPNYLFEDLVLDVFDEIDRRETEKSTYTIHFNSYFL